MAFQASLLSPRPLTNSLRHPAILDGWQSSMMTSDATPMADEDALLLTKQRLAFAFEISGDALWSFDVPSNHLALAGRWWSILGYETRDIDPTLQGWLGLTHPDDRIRLLRSLIAHLKGEALLIEIEYRIRTKSGVFVWTLARGKIAMSSSDGKPTLLIGTLIDITRLKERELAATYLARHDSLTGLPTRVAFHERLSRAIALSEKFALLACDLDGFKQVNDRLGHAAGDELLRIVAQRLLNAVRSKDFVARVGGDEFMIVLGLVGGSDGAWKAARRVMEAVAQPISLKGRLIEVGVSVGVAIGTENGTNVEDLCSFADAALYAAKANHHKIDRRKQASSVATCVRTARRRG